jgi:hypothetical protein
MFNKIKKFFGYCECGGKFIPWDLWKAVCDKCGKCDKR